MFCIRSAVSSAFVITNIAVSYTHLVLIPLIILLRLYSTVLAILNISCSLRSRSNFAVVRNTTLSVTIRGISTQTTLYF